MEGLSELLATLRRGARGIVAEAIVVALLLVLAGIIALAATALL